VLQNSIPILLSPQAIRLNVLSDAAVN